MKSQVAGRESGFALGLSPVKANVPVNSATADKFEQLVPVCFRGVSVVL